MGRRRPRLRKPRGAAEQVAAAVIALALLVWLLEAAKALIHALVRGWPVLAVLASGALAVVVVLWRRRLAAARVRAQRLARLRITLAEVDAMSDQDFEFALRDLLIRDGCTAQKVGQQGDQAADVIGQDPLRGRIVLQAKHTKVAGKVGSQVMYQVKGTAGPAHGADIAVVVTNGSFTRDAKAWGEKHQVHWVDRDRLRLWAEHGVALHDLLHLPSRPTRRTLGRPAA